jgi:hypothetical protein
MFANRRLALLERICSNGPVSRERIFQHNFIKLIDIMLKDKLPYQF